ncbi:uncharacterized protein LOC134775407 [Penaeus indicus]|uniref:uncharacterized protein LOC134775407 n=1 Tax=Penaeus indicus TaxID=29960 RepID=UPI00300C6972
MTTLAWCTLSRVPSSVYKYLLKRDPRHNDPPVPSRHRHHHYIPPGLLPLHPAAASVTTGIKCHHEHLSPPPPPPSQSPPPLAPQPHHHPARAASQRPSLPQGQLTYTPNLPISTNPKPRAILFIPARYRRLPVIAYLLLMKIYHLYILSLKIPVRFTWPPRPRPYIPARTSPCPRRPKPPGIPSITLNHPGCHKMCPVPPRAHNTYPRCHTNLTYWHTTQCALREPHHGTILRIPPHHGYTWSETPAPTRSQQSGGGG